MTGQQCEGTGEEVRRCSEQRCPGEIKIQLLLLFMLQQGIFLWASLEKMRLMSVE